MNGDRDDQVLDVDLAALNDDQREGLTCINCGRSGGRMRSIPTPANPPSIVSVHVDSGVCLRHVARYVEGLHMRMAGIAEHAVDALAQDVNSNDP